MEPRQCTAAEPAPQDQRKHWQHPHSAPKQFPTPDGYRTLDCINGTLHACPYCGHEDYRPTDVQMDALRNRVANHLRRFGA